MCVEKKGKRKWEGYIYPSSARGGWNEGLEELGEFGGDDDDDVDGGGGDDTHIHISSIR